MGETRDHLEEHGGPGMVWCELAQFYIAERCKDCVICAEWKPDEPEPADQAEYFDWLARALAIRAGWM